MINKIKFTSILNNITDEKMEELLGKPVKIENIIIGKIVEVGINRNNGYPIIYITVEIDNLEEVKWSY